LAIDGLEGYDRLAQLLKPHRDLRGFYFGVRSTIYRMCVPTEEGDTCYTELREIKIQQKGDGICIDYRPFRKGKIIRIMYTANTQSETLDPLRNPQPDGQDNLGGYFDKGAFDLILSVMEDVVDCIGSDDQKFESQNFSIPGSYSGTLKRVESEEDGNLVFSYRFYLKDPSGKEMPAEEIRFFISRNPTN